MEPTWADAKLDDVKRGEVTEDVEKFKALTKQARDALQKGNQELASALYAEAFSMDIPDAYVLGYKATILAQRGDIPKAVNFFSRSLQINPHYLVSRYNLAKILSQCGKEKEAEEHYRFILTFKPDETKAIQELADLYIHQKRTHEAAQACMSLVIFEPINGRYWQQLARVVSRASSLEFTQELYNAMRIAIASDTVESQDIRNCFLYFIAHVEPYKQLLRSVQTPEEIWREGVCTGQLTNVLAQSLFREMLTLFVLIAPAMEPVLTRLRRSYLEMTQSPEGLEALSKQLPVIIALAQQCWLGEFVFDLTNEEIKQHALLKESLLKEDALNEHILVKLAIYAAYEPLYKLQNAKTLAQHWKDDISPEIVRFFKTMLYEPLEEAALVSKLESFGVIDNEVSQFVREQYEESPYPRWRKARSGQVITYDNYLMQFNAVDPEAFKGKESLDVLIAGCGTGQHIITRSAFYPNAALTGIDLSRRSLAYAARKLRESGLEDKINLLHGDILELKSLDKSFDIIESVGVLHHMQEPEAGWRILTDILKPGGFMRIGLYSEIARRGINVFRQQINQQKLKDDAATIRAWRTEIKRAYASNPTITIPRMQDFYALSECRDLLFHRQEHQFNLLKIKEILARLDLTFLGFDIEDPAILRAYSQQFPEDKNRTSLENWHQFEQQNPDMFICMYQFWLQKPE